MGEIILHRAGAAQKEPELVIDLVKAEMRTINHFSLGGKSPEQEQRYGILEKWLADAAPAESRGAAQPDARKHVWCCIKRHEHIIPDCCDSQCWCRIANSAQPMEIKQ